MLGQRRRQAVLQSRALAGEHQPGAGQLAQVAQIGGRDPHRGQRVGALQPIQSVHVQFVGLVDQTHHEFGLARVNQQRVQSRLLDLADDPVPVARGFDGDGRAGGAALEGGADGAGRVLDALLASELAVDVFALH